ncbi:MAG: hypothetical protein ABID84_02745, partial [Chloroflexota bacterium]
FFPSRFAMRLFGTPCWYSSQASVISVRFDMSMRIHGQSDFYGNIADTDNGHRILARFAGWLIAHVGSVSLTDDQAGAYRCAIVGRGMVERPG